MFNKSILCFVLFLAAYFPIVTAGQIPKPHPDDRVYFADHYTIRGKVKILNHPALGEIVADHQFIFFQRIGCKNCFFGVTTDEAGNYEITVSKGKYRVIIREVRGGYTPSYDLLAPSQPRIIDATKSPGIGQAIEFNIMMKLPD